MENYINFLSEIINYKKINLSEKIDKLFENYSLKKRRIIKKIFGLDCKKETTKEISKKEKISISRIYQIKKEIIRKFAYSSGHLLFLFGFNEEIKKILVDQLPLPTRIINSLLRENIWLIEDLKKIPPSRLIKIKGIGKGSLILILEKLKKL